MSTKLLLLITLLAYSILVSQSFMYIMALKQVQLNLDAGTYIQVRKLIDAGMNNTLRYVIYAALLSNLALVMATAKSPGSLIFITAALAFAALLLDTGIAVKVNIPINEAIKTWTPENYPANWTEFRTKWLQYFQYRQMANISGFVSLMVGAVFGSK